MGDAGGAGDISEDTVLARRRTCLERRTRASVVVLGDELPIVLRGTGVAIWDAFATPRFAAEVATELAVAFDTSFDVVQQDMLPILAELRPRGRVDDRLRTTMTRVPTFRSLEHTFTLDATDPALCALLHQLFEANATEEPPAQRFSVEVQEGSFAVSADGNVVLNTKSPSLALAHTVWEINRRAIEQSNRMLVLHAAAAERAGRAVLLPGRSGSGKSTLVATLAAAGFGYLTDDAVAIDRFDCRALANAKPIGLARDVVPLFPLLADLPCDVRSYMGDEWYVTPAMLGGTVGSSAVPRLVVFPVYEAGATNDATPLSRAETLVMLAENSHNFTRFGADGLDFLAHLLPACACYRFQFSNAESVVDFIAEQLGPVEAAR